MADFNKCTSMLDEKEMLNDFLISQKLITSSYNTYAGECVNAQLRNTFLNILDDEHKIQADIFGNMQAKGFYQTEPAEQQKVWQAKQKLSQS